MRKILLKIFLFSLGVFLFSTSISNAEIIRDFDSEITVYPDASILVKEKIVYDFEQLERHGIFRNISLTNSQGNKIEIKDISVADENGQSYNFSKQIQGGEINIKIGDADKTITGEHEYNISYRVFGAIGYYENFDEIYWNVTGDKWPVTIEKSSARVILPNGAQVIQQACYYGTSNDKCEINPSGYFFSPRALNQGEQLTIATGFSKGVVAFVEPKVDSPFVRFAKVFWPILIPIFTFIVMFRKWHKKGRDPKGTGIIVAQYDVPDELTPLEASVIINQKFNGKDLIAEILFLATQGYISILQTQEKQFLGKKIDYTLTLKKIPTQEIKSFDKQLLQEIFNPGVDSPLIEGSTVTLSQSYSLFGITNSLSTKIKEKLVEGGYYTKDFLPKKIIISYKKFINILVGVVTIGFFGIKYLSTQTENLTSIFFGQGSIVVLIFIVSQFVAVGVAAFFKSIMPAKTKKGALTKEYLLGLKEYIKVAEKDRIAFHNAPEMNATLFEKLLPYAVMFGLEKKWAGAFEGINLSPPSWYSSIGAGFAPSLFVSDFSNNFSSSFFTAPSSSDGGSGGGGSSGGGGGGGGGGSW